MKPRVGPLRTLATRYNRARRFRLIAIGNGLAGVAWFILTLTGVAPDLPIEGVLWAVAILFAMQSSYSSGYVVGWLDAATVNPAARRDDAAGQG